MTPADPLNTDITRTLREVRHGPVRDVTGLKRFKTSFPVQGLG